jgi:hypothetical protein
VGIKTGRCGNIFAGFYSTTDVYKDKSRWKKIKGHQ